MSQTETDRTTAAAVIVLNQHQKLCVLENVLGAYLEIGGAAQYMSIADIMVKGDSDVPSEREGVIREVARERTYSAVYKVLILAEGNRGFNL